MSAYDPKRTLTAPSAAIDLAVTMLLLSLGATMRLPPGGAAVLLSLAAPAQQETSRMGIMSLIRWLFGADAAAPSDAIKLDGTTEATLVRSLSALPPDERGWITFAEARILFSTQGAQYAFGETDQDGRRNIESFAAQHRSVLNFMPVEGRVYFVRH
jgi:hypothetical protein